MSISEYVNDADEALWTADAGTGEDRRAVVKDNARAKGISMTTRAQPIQLNGWVGFAGIVLLIAGVFNIIDGFVAIANDDFFVADELLWGDLSAWGAAWLILGIVQIVTAGLIFSAHPLGQVFGITLAGLNAIGQLMFISVFPIWSVAIMVLDAFIIYALAVHGDVFEE